MKKPFLQTLTIVLCIAITSFKGHSDKSVAPDVLKNFVQVTERLCFNKFEVSNGDYHVFLHYLKANAPAGTYASCLPDTALWDSIRHNSPFKHFYFSHPSFHDYPLVAVTYQNAQAYCNWLTQQYHMDPNRKFKKVVFRLPTEPEWMYAASGGDATRTYPWKGTSLKGKKGIYRGETLCNYLETEDRLMSINENGKLEMVADSSNPKRYTSPVMSCLPNDFGLYNASGNVAEMVAEKGWAKGGSYNDPGFDVRIASKKQFSHAATDIGFRVAMEIIER